MIFKNDVTLFATTKIVITAVEDTEVELYVPNKDNLPVVLAKGKKLTIVSSNAGEIFHYLVQQSDKLTIDTSANATAGG